MSWPRVLGARLRGLFVRNRLERELDDEVRFHLDMLAEDNRRAGMDPAEARQAAMRSFGAMESMKEQYRERRTLALIETIAKDLRHALRTMRRSPGFTMVAVMSLALGIGANTAIFTLIDAVMLRSLPVQSPDELVSVGDASRPTALWEGAPMLGFFSYPLYERLRDQNQVFTGLLASGRSGHVQMSVGDGALEEVHGRLVSGNYFEVLGVLPAVGRTFSADDDRTPGAGPVVVIAHRCWETRFARDPGILGRTLRLNGWPFTVIGVGPRHFTGDVVGSPTDIWIPLSMQAQLNRGEPRLARRDSNWLLCMGRLRPGVSVQKARAEMTMLAQQALIDYEGAAVAPDKLRDIRTQTVDVAPGGRGFSRIRKYSAPLLSTLMAVVGLVLVIACANVANLLLARATSRQKEISVRLALGASRGRLIRQMLTESALLAAIGGAAGLLLAGWGSRLLSRLTSGGGPNPVPFDVDVHPHAAVLAFTVTVSALSAVLTGLVPALRSTRIDLTPSLKESARSLDRGGWPLGKLLVIGQLALSVPLLVGAGLFVRSLAHLETLDVGYSRDNLVLLKADLGGSGHTTTGQQFSLTRTLLERLGSVPGVLGVTVSENGIFSGTDSGTDALQVEGFHALGRDDSSSRFDQVGPHYFQVVGVPILAGRDFHEKDTAGAPPVAIINDTMARFYFDGGDPLGKSIRNGGDRYTIVGVVKDSKQRDLRGKAERRFYLPMFQSEDRIAAFNFEIRTRDDAAGMLSAIRHELQRFDHNLTVPSLESVRVLMDQSIQQERFIAQLSGFFGILALFLAAHGLYGVMSYATSRRTNEIGLRMSLGADRGDVIAMVLRDTLGLIAMGLAIGLPAALVATRLIAATLIGVSARDPATVGVATLVMLIVGVFAGFVPAQRASRVDPMVALRQH